MFYFLFLVCMTVFILSVNTGKARTCIRSPSRWLLLWETALLSAMVSSMHLQRFFEDKCFRQIDAFDPNSCFSACAVLHLLGGKLFESTLNLFVRFVNSRQKQKQKMFLAGLLFSANYLWNSSGCTQENHAPELSVSVLVDTFQHDMGLCVRHISGLWRY